MSKPSFYVGKILWMNDRPHRVTKVREVRTGSNFYPVDTEEITWADIVGFESPFTPEQENLFRILHNAIDCE